MKMRTKIFTMIVLLCTISFSSCSKDDTVITSINLDKTTLSVQIEDIYQFVVNYTPSDLPAPICKWESDNEDIISINEKGEAKAISIGEAEITVTTSTNLQATCKVTVTPIQATSITLSKSTMSLFVGEEETLTYILSPENTTYTNVVWSSSDSTIATIDNTGKVIGVSTGIAQITIESESGITDICEVTINPIKVEGISFTETTKTIEQEEIISLDIEFKPIDATNQKINWGSSDANIVAVSKEGEITGVGKGIANITATTEDGEYTAICNITVVEITVKSIDINTHTLSLAMGDTYAFTATISPINAANQNIKWMSSNPSIAAINDNGVITANKIGDVTIRVIAEDGEHTNSCYVKILEMSDILDIKARGRSLSASSSGIELTLHSKLTNTSQSSITFHSIWLINENREVLDIKSAGGVVLKPSQYIYSKYKELFFYGANFDREFQELLSTYKVVYQFEANGKNYHIEENIDGGHWTSSL